MPAEGVCQTMTIFGDGQLERLLGELFADEEQADDAAEDVWALQLPGQIPIVFAVCCVYSYTGYS